MEQEGCDRYRVHDAHAFQSCMVERKKESRGVETLPGMCVCLQYSATRTPCLRLARLRGCLGSHTLLTLQRCSCSYSTRRRTGLFAIIKLTRFVGGACVFVVWCSVELKRKSQILSNRALFCDAPTRHPCTFFWGGSDCQMRGWLFLGGMGAAWGAQCRRVGGT